MGSSPKNILVDAFMIHRHDTSFTGHAHDSTYI